MRAVSDLGFIDARPSDPAVSRKARTAEQHRRRLIGNVVFAVVFSAISIGWFTTLRPERLGGPATFVMVQGTSMNPMYHTGDLVIVHRQAHYEVGDIIAYQIPQGQVGARLTVIHRIVGGSPTIGFTTRGDNNPALDDWHPTLADIQGSPWLLVPKGGNVLAFLHAPIPLAALSASLVVAWIVYQEEAPSIRRRRRSAGALAPDPQDGTASEDQT
jgi:signal peptidase I